MAKKGVEYVNYGILDEKTGKYSEQEYLGTTAKFGTAPTTNTTKDYGDNGVVATDTSVTNGTMTVEINELVDHHYAKLLGHSINEETGAVISNSYDVAPFIGIGCIGNSTGEKPWKVVFYPKAQFKEPGDEYNTKTENITFNHSSLEGEFYTLENGDYSIKNSFKTKQEAKDYLDQLLGKTTLAKA